jgi:hypothetical protein
MSKALPYFLASGAAGVGGLAAAGVLFRLGQQEAAAHTLARDPESFARLLQIQIDQAPLRKQALAVGVDPDLVEQGYRDMRDRLGHG